MSTGIIIHITVGSEKRTEFFPDERIRIGSDETCDLQVLAPGLQSRSLWFEIENSDGMYRVVEFDDTLGLKVNEQPLRRFIAITDGDVITVTDTEVSFAFFSLETKSALITTNRETPHISRFIEDAALEAAGSGKRDDAKAFLREFVRELYREISWTTKAITLVILAAFVTGILYIGFAVSEELRKSRQQSEVQSSVIQDLEKKLGQTNDTIGELDKTNKDLMKTVSLAPNLRVSYGNGVCLIVGLYDLVDKKSGKVLRYADPQSSRPGDLRPWRSSARRHRPRPCRPDG